MPPRSAEPPTRRAPAADEDTLRREPAPEEDATEPLVRRRRPRPEWLRDGDPGDEGDEPLMWPREDPPDR
jgi:hypothetical protein